MQNTFTEPTAKIVRQDRGRSLKLYHKDVVEVLVRVSNFIFILQRNFWKLILEKSEKVSQMD